MLECGIAYRKKSRVNWCPQCETVLANEQVVNGCCWRHEDTPVKAQRTRAVVPENYAYAEQLLDGHEGDWDGWPERVLTMQRNWIGKSQGARVRFRVEGSDAAFEVFTTRIDTIYGATSVLVSPENPLVADVAGWRFGVERQIMPSGFAPQARLEDRGNRDRRKRGFFHRPICAESLFGREDSYLGCQFRARGIWDGRADVRSGA